MSGAPIRGRTPRPLPRRMPRAPADPCRVVAPTLALVLLLAVPAVGATEHTPGPGEGEVLIILHTTGHDAEGPLLRYTLVAALSVGPNDDGTEVRVPLPAGAALDSLAPTRDAETLEPTTDTERQGGRDWAVARWGPDGPQTGEWVAMRLEAREALDNADRIAVEWTGLPQNLTSVRIFLPATHIPVVDAAHAPAREQGAGSLVGWNLTEPPSEELRFTIRAVDLQADPALGAPPIRLGGFLVLAGIMVAAALVWFLGKKVDSRMRRD